MAGIGNSVPPGVPNRPPVPARTQSSPFGQALSPFGTGNRRPALARSAASAVTFPSFFTTHVPLRVYSTFLQGSTVAAFVPRFYSEISGNVLRSRRLVLPFERGKSDRLLFGIRGRTTASTVPIRQIHDRIPPCPSVPNAKGTRTDRSPSFIRILFENPHGTETNAYRDSTPRHRRHIVNHRTAAL